MNGILGFRDTRRGETIYVLGSGATLNHLEADFFADKVTIALNTLAFCWPVRPTYIVTKYHEEGEQLAEALPDVPVVIPRWCHGNLNSSEAASERPNVYVFDHGMNPGPEFDAGKHWPLDPDGLVVSWSTITTAMHLAAYLGAGTIILVGHDCGQLGGETHVAGYQPPPTIDELPFLLQIEGQSVGVKKQLIARYGVRVWSLSPFLNYNLEGVPYIGRNRINAA
jgi:hypothetical protein